MPVPLLVPARDEAERARAVHLQEELNRAWNDAVPLRESAVRLAAELDDLKAATATEREELLGRIARLDERRAALEEPAERSVVLEREREDWQKRGAGQAETIERLTAERDRTASDLAAAKVAHAEAHQQASKLPDAMQRIAELERQVAETTDWADAASRRAAELPEKENRLAAMTEANAELERRFHELETHAAGLEQERAELQHKLAGAEEAAVTLETLLTEAEAERERLRTRASEDVANALRRVRQIAAAAEKLMISLATASVLPAHREESSTSPTPVPAEPDAPRQGDRAGAGEGC